MPFRQSYSAKGEMFWEHLMTLSLLKMSYFCDRLCVGCRGEHRCPHTFILFGNEEHACATVMILPEPTTSADINQTIIALTAPYKDNVHKSGPKLLL